jgi:peptide deformylase
MLKIINAPNKVLSQQAKPIEKIDKTIRKLIKNMEQALIAARDPEGVGLAAPQVAVSLQLFLIKQTPQSSTLVFINPKIEEYIDDEPEQKKQQDEKSDKEKGVQLEGCLSLQDIWGVVKRSHSVILSYQDETGKTHKKKFSGFIATIIQHEVDHLTGALFTKRVLEQQNPLYHHKKNENGEVEYEKIEL